MKQRKSNKEYTNKECSTCPFRRYSLDQWLIHILRCLSLVTVPDRQPWPAPVCSLWANILMIMPYQIESCIVIIIYIIFAPARWSNRDIYPTMHEIWFYNVNCTVRDQQVRCRWLTPPNTGRPSFFFQFPPPIVWNYRSIHTTPCV